MNGEQVKDILQKQLRRLVVLTLLLFVALAGVGAYAYVAADHARKELARVSLQTSTALCTLRADLEQRVKDSQRFLDEHPNGIPGISATAIKESIVNQQRTIDALDILNCPPTVTGEE